MSWIDSILDVNRLFEDPYERLSVARKAVGPSTYGLGRLVEVALDPDTGIVEFISKATGKRSSFMSEVISDIGKYGIEAFSSINIGQVRRSVISRDLAGDKIGSMGSFLEGIINQLPSKKDRLIELGLSEDFLNKFMTDGQVNVTTLGGNLSSTAASIGKQLDQGQLFGIPLLDPKGSRLLTFSASGEKLTSIQSNILMSVLDNDIIGSKIYDKALKAIETGNDQNLPSIVAEQIAKVGKRLRSHLADRVISVSGKELSEFLGGKTLEQATLVLRPQRDILSMLASSTANAFGGDKGLTAYYRELNTESYRAIFESKGLTDSRVTQAIKATLNETGQSVTGDSLIAEVMKKLGPDTDGEIEKSLKMLFKTIEHDFDGSDLLNKKNVKGYLGSLRQLRQQISNSTADAGRLYQIDEAIAALSSSMEYGYQITGRGRFGGEDIKTAFQITEFSKKLSKYAAIVTDFGRKRETDIMGATESLRLSGFGVMNDIVYADPALAAFNPLFLADDATMRAVEMNEKRLMKEFSAVVETGIMPKKLKSALERAAQQDISAVDASKTASAMRNREYAQSILDLHRRGVNPRHSPQMMNAIFSFMQGEAFKIKGDMIFPALADVGRFAVGTEAALAGQGGEAILSGSKRFSTMSVQLGGQGNVGNFDFYNFRIKDKKALFGQGAVAEIYDTLGGFDLDDKILEKLTTFKDSEGRSKLAFAIFRQPSGPEEFLLTRMSMDIETIQSLFGKDEFISNLEEMIESGSIDPSNPSTKRLMQLRSILEDTRKGTLESIGYNTPELIDEVEAAILDVVQRARGGAIPEISQSLLVKASQRGTSPLVKRLDDILEDSTYVSEAIRKLNIESQGIDIRPDLNKIIERGGLPEKYIDRLTEIAGMDMNQSLRAMMEAAAPGAEDKDMYRAIFSMVFQEKSRTALETNSENLGRFINRSMAVGSVLDQIQDISNAGLGANGREATDYMLRNFKIGILSQELAIDSSVNLTGTKILAAEVGRMTEEAGAVLPRAIAELGGFGSELTLDQIGDQMVRNLGRYAGFTQVTGNLEQSVKFDPLLVSSRLRNNVDMENLARGIIEGIEESFAAGYARPDLVAEDLTKGITDALIAKDFDSIRKMIMSDYTLSKDNQYAVLSKMERSQAYNQLDQLRRSAISSIEMSPDLASADISAQEDAVARRILERHRESLDFLNTNAKGLKDSSLIEEYQQRIRAQYVGDAFLKDVQQAGEVEGIRKRGLLDALDRNAATTGIKFDKIDFIRGSNQEQIYFEMFDNRALRKAEYYANLEQLTDIVLEGAGSKTPINLENLQKIASQQLEKYLNQSIINPFDADVYRALAGEDLEAVDAIQRDLAQREANIIRARVEIEEIRAKDTYAGLTRTGAITAESVPADEAFIREMIEATTESLDDSGTTAKVGYQRITKQYLKERLTKPSIRGGLLGLAALSAASFIYMGNKDRTQEDMQGPPLLPGGSAYEAMPARTPQLPVVGGNNMAQGVSYNVNISGSYEDIDSFNQDLSGMNIGNYNATIYNKIPDLSSGPLTKFMDIF